MSFAKVKGLHGLRHTHMFAICSMYEHLPHSAASENVKEKLAASFSCFLFGRTNLIKRIQFFQKNGSKRGKAPSYLWAWPRARSCHVLYSAVHPRKMHPPS